MTYWEEIKAHAQALKGDGCTMSPDIHYTLCCDEHDIHYRTHRYLDGTPITKEEADKHLLKCMQERSVTFIGKFFISRLYYYAVKFFGKKAWDNGPPNS